MSFVFMFGLTVLLLAAGFVWMILRLTMPGGARDASLEWLEEFCIDKYAPMERLLDANDYSFLSLQPGYAPAIAKRLKTERRRLFREYLTLLKRDFHRLVALANVMVVYGEEDRASLASAIWEQRIAFYRTVLFVEFELALEPLGVQVSGVSDLVRALGNMRIQVVELVPAPLMSAA